eukprot:CAMPEP_0116127296 /NCGR_PEP_ID=MMETSP0329-20121206/6769_1 /TAXON_ID=697910 /ORGANISM="Pseudo-nitzschia arenysensis, Strain B593" /LENGTH=2217 /DNA_ID=CAMNT_0003621395 /DNA_START=65 /DNA_END=6718 /DNA_ORIENTATION=-
MAEASDRTGLFRAIADASRRSPLATRLSNLVEQRREAVQTSRSPDPIASIPITPRVDETYAAISTESYNALVPPAPSVDPAPNELDDSEKGQYTVEESTNRSRVSVDPDGRHSGEMHSLEVHTQEVLQNMSEARRLAFHSETSNPSGIDVVPESLVSTPPKEVRQNTLGGNGSILTTHSGFERDDRPNKQSYPQFQPITMDVHGNRCTFVPNVEGFDHPYRRGWSGFDRSTAPSDYKYYAVKTGYDSGIYNSYGGAWVRVADFKDNTGFRAEFRGFDRYSEAVAYLGWDPDVEENSASRHYRPPPRTSSAFPGEGPDPHNWIGYPPDETQPKEIEVDHKSFKSRNTEASVSTVSESITTLHGATEQLVNEIRDMKHQQAKSLASKEEQQFLHLLNKTEGKHFPALSKEMDPTLLGKWKFNVESILLQAHWLVDGCSIISLDDSIDMSDAFKARSYALCRVLMERLVDFPDIVNQYTELITQNRGVSLYHGICHFLHPNTDSSALAEYRRFFSRRQENGESVQALCRDLQLMYNRLIEIGIPLHDQVLTVQLMSAVFGGAYSRIKGLDSFHDDLVRGRTHLADMEFSTFRDGIHSAMLAAGLQGPGGAKRLPSTQVARRILGGNASNDGGEAWLGQANLDDTAVDALFRWTKCPICRIPRGGKDHQISDCPQLKCRGVVMKYDASKDEMRKQREQSKRSETGPKSTADSSNNSDSGPSHSAKRVISTNMYEPLFVDAHNSKDEPIDYCSGICRKTVSFASNPQRTTLVADSGATSDMFAEREYFEDDYKKCKNVSVYMGDGSPVKVEGIGTATIKIEGHTIRLPNVLHVPQLDCNLMSITQHGLRGSGCTYLVENGEIHLTFPNFVLSMPIPPNGDPRFTMEPASATDRKVVEYDGTASKFTLETVMGRQALLRHIHRGRAITRGKLKKELADKKDIIKIIAGDKIREPSKSHSLMPPLNEELTETELREDEGAPTLNIPNTHVVESATGSQVYKYTRNELETLFGGRQLADYRVLEGLGTGIRVTDNDNEVPSVGRLVNRRRGRRQKESETPTYPKSLVGMDIGYGPSTSPGGYKYVLVLVDKCTSHTWIYGMGGTSGADIQEALWRFFVDIDGFPGTIQCDFDPRFLGGKAKALLQSHGCRIRAAPPNRQSQNGLVERKWQSLQGMARSLLTDARLPTKFWYWAIREAATRINILPISSNPKDITDRDYLTTPHEAFYGTKPDYRILFPFGCLGSFRRVRDGTKNRSKFASQGLVGIALGRSEFTNGIIFYNPTLDSFSTSADFYLDRKRVIGEMFPDLQYDGGLTTSVWSVTRADTPSKFDVGEAVFVLDSEKDIQTGIVEIPPTAQSEWYTVRLETGESIVAGVEDIFTEYTVPATGPPTESLGFFAPEWLKQDSKVTYLYNGSYHHGYLALDNDYFWEFVTRSKDGKVNIRVPLPDLAYSWKSRIQENVLQLGWQNNVAYRIYGINRHVSASTLKNTMAPANLIKGLHPSNPDAVVWRSAYDEEYDGLVSLETMVEIDEAEYQALIAKHGEAAMAIPTMNLFTVKMDKEGKPVRAKSRIVILGNLERRIWEKVDRYAPVMNAASGRLIVSMAVEVGRIVKQGDCKNAFCQPWLPEEEITVVRPPKGCPRSKPGIYWLLKKTLYGLSRSPKHWYDTFSGLLKKLGFKAMLQDPCVFKCTPMPGKPPIYVGMYVDDFIYFSESDQVEEWFETALGAELKVDFMGPVSWFLGCNYDWHKLPDGRLTCHISQQAFVEQLLEKFDMSECSGSNRLFKSGHPIDRIDREVSPECATTEFIRKYQSLMGGLTWLVISTRPDINVATKLLSKFNCNPSMGHFKAAKQVLQYLKSTASHGIWFTQGEERLQGNVGIPPALDPNHLTVFTDSCWGPQLADKPKANETRTAHIDEMNSLQGHYVTRMGGALLWGVEREKRTSGSSCEAEIKAMDEGTKAIQFMRHLCTQLGLRDATAPVPLLNDNRGSVDWGKNGGVVTKKLRHANIREARVAEAQKYGEIDIYWIPGKDNPADLFTKEHKDLAQFNKLRDMMVRPREWVHQQQCDKKSDQQDTTYSTSNVIAQKKVAAEVARLAKASVRRENLEDDDYNGQTPGVYFGEECQLNKTTVTALMSSLAVLKDPTYMSSTKLRKKPQHQWGVSEIGVRHCKAIRDSGESEDKGGRGHNLSPRDVTPKSVISEGPEPLNSGVEIHATFYKKTKQSLA